MSLDDQMDTPTATDDADASGAMDAQYAAFQAGTHTDDGTGAGAEPAAAETVPPEEGQDGEQGIDPQFATVEQFVTEWVMPLYVRNTASDRWCRQWWAHPEAAQRLEALWEAYEAARSSKDGGAFAAWWRTEADHHLPLLYSDQGPFRKCDARSDTHTPQTPQPVSPAPAGTYVADGPAHGGPNTATSTHTDGQETGRHGTTRTRGDARRTGPGPAGGVAGPRQPAGTPSPPRPNERRPNAGSRRR